MRKWIKVLAIVGLLFMPAMLSACNTVEGAGKDTENAGKAVKNAANDNK